MTTIGFIGLGIMGGPMAANLVRAGFDVIGYNRSPARTDRLVEAGGRAAATVPDAVRGSDFVLSCLPDSPDVERIAMGTDGVFDHARPGALYIDMSTIAPATAVKVAEAGRARGIAVLDAPVSGGEKGAIDGILSIMVGGDAGDLETARPVLRAMGTTIVHVGGPGAGQTVKAANQLFVRSHHRSGGRGRRLPGGPLGRSDGRVGCAGRWTRRMARGEPADREVGGLTWPNKESAACNP